MQHFEAVAAVSALGIGQNDGQATCREVAGIRLFLASAIVTIIVTSYTAVFPDGMPSWVMAVRMAVMIFSGTFRFSQILKRLRDLRDPPLDLHLRPR